MALTWQLDSRLYIAMLKNLMKNVQATTHIIAQVD